MSESYRSPANPLRVLFLGENWYGSCARACCYALRRLGCDVLDIDSQTIHPQWRQLSSRAILRGLTGIIADEYSNLILDNARSFKPDLLLAFKAPDLKAKTLKALRQQGIALYNYYPDTSVFAHRGNLPEALPEYDCVFFTKKFGERDVREKLHLRDTHFLPHGYDAELHYPHQLSEIDKKQYGCDVGVIATYTQYKENVLKNLVSKYPEIDLQIWGNQWEKCQSPKLKKYIKGFPLTGSSYAKAIGTFRINLAIMSGKVRGASEGDQTTTRTYEIPACGGLMLHERSIEVLELYEEGKEIACFDSTTELVEKIEYYLAHPEKREEIARAGYARCVPAYSYDNRMMEILKWHQDHHGN